MLGPPEVQAQETGLTVSSQQILFPALRLLSIEEQIGLDSMNFDLLLETLRLRKTAGYGISSLHICPYTGESQTELRLKLLDLKASLNCRVSHCRLEFSVDRSKPTLKFDSL